MTMTDTTEMEKRLAARIDPESASRLELSQAAGGLGFTNMAQAMEFARMMAVAQTGVRKHLRGNVGACLAVTIQAVEWGISPFAVANKSYVVNDQLAFESQLVQAVILKRAPTKGRIKFSFEGEGVKRRCRASATMQDGEVVDYISPEVGKIPIKNSPLWKNDEDQQLCYYSGRALCRRHFPDVLLGIYTPEELDAETHHQGPDNARDVSSPKTISAKLDALASGPDTRGIMNVGLEHAEHDEETGEVIGEHTVHEVATDVEDKPDETERDTLISAGQIAAQDGTKGFNAWWAARTDAERALIGSAVGSLLAGAKLRD